MRIRIKQYAPSNSVKLLTKDLQEAGIKIKKILLSGSTFRGRRGDIIINWGSPKAFTANDALLLNKPAAVNVAANKISAFKALKAAGVQTVRWTVSREEAAGWPAVFCRHELRGHSGSGIAYCSQQQPEHLGGFEWLTVLPQAPLYTEAVVGKFKEYRLHVFAGEVVCAQQKKRRNGWRENPDYSAVVRNHHTNWVYTIDSMDAYPDSANEVAVEAVKAVGLDFGAVDLILQGDEAYVLEVNTAPGLAGESTRLAYKNAFMKVINNV